MIHKQQVIDILEEMIKELENANDNHLFANGGYERGRIEGIGYAISRIQSLPEYSGWISVKDRLPKIGDEDRDFNCIVWCEYLQKQGVETCTYDGKEKYWFTHPANVVTHWQPLPTIPTSDN